MSNSNVLLDDDDNVRPGCALGIVSAVLVLAFAIFWFSAATWESVPPDKIGLHYTGGPFQGTHYKSVIQPGTHAQFYGLADHIYLLPATQRNYIVSRDPDAGDAHKKDFISAPSKDRVPFTFEAAVYFKLNTKPEVLKKFFQNICLHDKCWDLSPGGGWDKMLAQFLRPQLDFAVSQAAKQFDREDLYSNPETLDHMNTVVENNLKDDVNAKLGGEFFCGPNSAPNKCDDFQVVIKNPTPPSSVTQAYSDTAASQQKIKVAQQDAQAAVAAAQGKADSAVTSAKGDAEAQRERASAPALSPAQIQYQQTLAMQACAQSPHCTLIVSPSGTGVNVNTGG